ncbi:MAG: phosphate-starvation-inducible protein PsiE [Pelagibacterales bacterium]|nr:phosphate-starvation-inducible protein PsiE [Pelagibacterales bacterium]MAH89242.1 phosphate-starvation-inducible protein PsiE [Pelagibacterales bacterium]OUU61929.1 MAG: phosphate-starvation-inducible protein PsiE [Alphaproteobacteria bacterium TMED62]|tara:strand:+ start:105 stop:536 length:432 start_codon:yes stop_codon:yes gene_type:complete
MENNIEKNANKVGNFLVRAFHYLALFAIGSAIVWSAFFTFIELLEKTSASIEDILLLFIYLELGAIVGIYFKTDHMPVRFLIYVGITALTRMLLEYLNEWHSSPTDQIHYEILIICGGIVMLAIGILILRYASHNYPSKTENN